MAMTLITTNSETNATTSSFTSSIDSTYKLYIFKLININPATAGGLFGFQANVDGQSGYNETITSSAFHARHTEADNVAQLAYGASFDQAEGTGFQSLSYDATNDADATMAGELYIFNPSNTTYVKHFYATVNEMIRNGAGASSNNRVAGYFNVTGAIDEVQFKCSSGNFDGTIKMYGVG